MLIWLLNMSHSSLSFVLKLDSEAPSSSFSVLLSLSVLAWGLSWATTTILDFAPLWPGFESLWQDIESLLQKVPLAGLWVALAVIFHQNAPMARISSGWQRCFIPHCTLNFCVLNRIPRGQSNLSSIYSPVLHLVYLVDKSAHSTSFSSTSHNRPHLNTPPLQNCRTGAACSFSSWRQKNDSIFQINQSCLTVGKYCLKMLP